MRRSTVLVRSRKLTIHLLPRRSLGRRSKIPAIVGKLDHPEWALLFDRQLCVRARRAAIAIGNDNREESPIIFRSGYRDYVRSLGGSHDIHSVSHPLICQDLGSGSRHGKLYRLTNVDCLVWGWLVMVGGRLTVNVT
jgi:hypothetical protein